MTIDDLLGVKSLDSVPADIQANLNDYVWKLNKFLDGFQGKVTISSGYRTQEEEEAVYISINERRKVQGLDPILVPKDSRHCHGLAADFWDPNDDMKNYALSQKDLAHDLGLHFEISEDHHLHIQIVPSESGKMWFYP